MQFNRRNINKRLRNGDIISSSLYSSNSSGGSSSGGILSGNYLPATQNADGTYTVDLTQVNFNGNVIASGEVSAYRIGSSSGSTGTSSSGSVTIYDGLDSDSATIALSANQGRVLKNLIDTMGGDVDLSDYYTKDQIDDKLSNVDIDLSDYLKTTTFNTHTESTVHITPNERTNWNTAFNNNHTHSNKSVIDGISSTNVTNWNGVVSDWNDVFSINSDGSLRVKVNLYGDGEVSAFGSGATSTDINLENYYTKTQIDNMFDTLGGNVDIDLSEYSKTSHTHNDLYYTETEITNLLKGKSDSSHTHNYTSVVKLGDKEYNVSDNTISLPAYPTYTLSGLGGVANNTFTAHTASTAHITSTERTNWNTAFNNNHTHSNKSVLDGISSTKVSNWDGIVSDWNDVFEIDSNGNLKVKVNLYGQGEISAYGSGATGSNTDINLGNYYTKDQIDGMFDTMGGNVDLSDYYTKAQVNTKLGDYSTTAHTHSAYSPTSHTHSQYASSSHTHSISNITNLQSTLDGKSGTGHSHSNYSVTSHTHSQYASSSHTHSISNITNLQSTLDGKSGTGHSHSNYSVTSHTHALSALTSTAHTHNYAQISDAGTYVYDATISRTANTVLAAPNGSAGKATFRSLVAADIPTLAISKISGLQTALDGKAPTHSHPYASSSHTHSISNITNLQSTLDGKSGTGHSHSNYSVTSHTHNYAGSSSAGGAATSANKVNSTLSFSAGTFSANSFNGSAAKTVYVPTHTSHITNNSGFITSGATVAKANQLTNSRTLWGQTFNGTANVTGNITGSYFKINDTSSNPYLQLTQGSTWYLQGYNGYLYMGAGSTKSLRIDSNGNCYSVGEVTSYSDKRLKDNIQPLDNRGYVQPYTYDKDGKKSIGFLAQDMQELYPELVSVDESTEEKYLSINYMQYTAVLQQQIIDLKKEIDELKDIIKDIKK